MWSRGTHTRLAQGALPASDIVSFAEIPKLRAQSTPDNIALRHLVAPQMTAKTLTFGELDVRARAIAASLQDRLGKNAKGQRAILLFDCNLEYVTAFFGCLYAGVIPVPAYPPDPSRLARMVPRLLSITRNCSPSIILSSGDIMLKLRLLLWRHPSLTMKRWLATDSVPGHLAAQYKHVDLNASLPAFLQYTSGSTGAPKGVIVTHRNLLHSCEWMARATGTHPDDHCLSWLPLYHDMGLIGTILTPVTLGIEGTFFSPLGFLREPKRWLTAMSDYRASITGGPNFGYELALAQLDEATLEKLDLKRWRVAFCGAEPIRPASLTRFADKLAPRGFSRDAFYPTYGLAEATLMVSGGFHSPETVKAPRGPQISRYLSCGPKFSDDSRIEIVDPETRTAAAPGTVGEIWVQSPSVAAGYWNRPEASLETFGAELASPAGQGKFLRTGDLGFMEDGNLFVTGRLKDVIIINGANHFPADIETTINKAHPALRPGCATAFSVDEGGRERLVIVAESRTHDYSEALHQEITKVLADRVRQAHDLMLSELVLLKKGSIPKTTSGKLQRPQAKKDYLANSLLALHPYGRTLPRVDATMAEGEAEEWIRERLSSLLSLDASVVRKRDSLATLGLDSVRAVAFAADIEKRTGREFNPVLLYQYSTIEALAKYLEGSGDEANAPEERTPTSVAAALHEPVALIGMNGVFPGAADLRQHWENLVAGKVLISDSPTTRWDWSQYPSAMRRFLESRKFLRGGFIDDVDAFDHAFFEISPREAALMDPQQRLLLQIVWNAIADAGLRVEDLAGGRTGVFVGASASDYAEQILQSGNVDFYQATGNAHSILANRVSFLFDFRGPSKTIDTACSSSLVAVVEAIEALRRGDCEVAIVAGVNAILSPRLTYLFARAGMLSPDGLCHTFDRKANGYVRGEGCGAIVLKTAARARADGDPIYAILRGGAVSHGGRTASLTAPSPRSQTDLLREAWQRAGIEGDTLTYVETHGTGTSLGDSIELEALRQAFPALAEGDASYCAIGSLKTNIGHLEAAAGIAGLIKVALGLRHNRIPATRNLTEPNPYLKLDGSPFFPADSTLAWTHAKGLRRAGVSSFGFGGTNAHVVVEEYLTVDPPSPGGSFLFPLSARTETALRAQIEKLLAFLRAVPDEKISLAAIAYTLQTGRDHHPVRTVVEAATLPDLVAKLEAFLAGNRPPFTGHAALWVRGETIDWASLWKGPVPRRLNLPGYAFDKHRHWLPRAAGLVDDTWTTVNGALFEKRLTPDLFYVRDHVVETNCVLPAVAYLESVWAAASRHEEPIHGLADIAWIRPAVVGERPFLLRGEIGNGIFELKGDAGELLSRGRMLTTTAPPPPDVDLDAVRSTLIGEPVPAETIYGRFRELGLNYGRTFQAMRHVHEGHETALAYLELPQGLTLEGFDIHPSLFDAALGACVGIRALFPDGKLITYVPSALEGFRLYRKVPHHLFAIARLRETVGESRKYDVTVTDYEGRVVAEMKGALVRPYRRQAADRLQVWKADWTSAPPAPAGAPSPTQILRWDHEAVSAEEALIRVHRIYGEWKRSGGSTPWRGLVVGRESSVLSMIAAFGRSFVGENFTLGTLLVDGSVDDATLGKATAVLTPGVELRAGEDGLRRIGFGHHALEGAPRLKTGGAYLVTGGLGGIGLALARHLVSKHRAKLILTGRRAPEAKLLSELGADVHYFQGDIAKELQVAALRDFWKAKVGRLDGVFHLAGLQPTGRAEALSEDECRAVLAPKDEGTRLLDRYTADEPLAFFAGFSSVSAAIGDFGAGVYGAANRLLDARLEDRAKRDAPGVSLSLGWPLWKDGAMALPEPVRTGYAERTGFAPLPNDEAMAALEKLLGLESGTYFIGWGKPERIEKLLPRPHVVKKSAGGEGWVRESLAGILGLQASAIDPEKEFSEYGADSVNMMEFLQLLQGRYPTIAVTHLFENPTLGKLERFLRSLDGTPEPVQATTGAASAAEGPVSAVQAAAWYLQQRDPESFAYNIPLTLHFAGGLDEEAARRAVTRLLRRQPVLGDVFESEDGEIRRIHRAEAYAWKRFDAADARAAESWLLTRARVPFDLARGPLFRVDVAAAGAERWIQFVTHHIVFDGLSCQLLLQDWLGFYAEEKEGRSSPTAPVRRSFDEFVDWQGKFLTTAEGERQAAYWENRLAGELPTLELPRSRPRPPSVTSNGATYRFPIEAELAQSLKALARAEKTTLFSVLLSGFYALLYRYTGQEDVIVGSPLLGRTPPGFEGTIGYFVNMVALRQHVRGDLPFRKLLGEVTARVREAIVNQDFPFPKLVERLRVPRDPSRSPIFQVAFVFQNMFDSLDELTAKHHCRFVPLPQQEGQFDIELEILERRGALQVNLKYNADCLPAEAMSDLARHYRSILGSLLHAPGAPLKGLELMPAEEKETIVEALNRTALPWPDERPLPFLVSERAAAHPDRLAVRFGEQSLTYGELDARVNRTCHYLLDHGVDRGAIVGLSLERSLDLVVAIHACWRLGAAYLPLDPHYPRERLAAMCADAAPKLILDAERCREALRSSDVPVVPRCEPSDPAYLLYTSGSTGTPKGVVNEHGGLANRVRWMQAEYALTPEDTVLQKTPFTFDVSVWEFLWPLAFGARLVVAAPGRHGDISHLQELIAGGVTTLHFVPSMLQAFLAVPWPEAATTSVRQVFCSGEALPADSVRRFLERFPQAKLHNLYGPTEAAIDVSFWECAAGEDPVPIGRPIANTQLLVLDRDGNPVPIGVPGELHIGGRNLARGYLNRPELTSERFITTPFGRLYRTGDRARLRSDGAIEYLGRLDHQVKLRGQRLELGEIECALREVDGVADAAVTVWGDTPADQQLVAYWVGSAEEKLLEERLRRRLPEYMIPARWMALENLPRTTSGKLDRQRLPRPARVAAGGEAASPLEASILAVLRDVLAAHVGPEEDFFAAGGTSLKALLAVERLRRELDLEITVSAFLLAPSARGLARLTDGGAPAPVDLPAERAREIERLPAGFAAGAAEDPSDILLTGATGFLGAYLLRDLLLLTRARIHCLVRAADEAEGRARLEANLSRYGLLDGELPQRVTAIPGDLAKPGLGLADPARADLADTVDWIVHCGALVNFLRPYAVLKQANVDGTAELLALCAAGRPKRFLHVSTISVFASRHIGRNELIEEDRPLPDSGLVAGYAQSKWVAEALVEEARRRGLDARIYRPGTLMGDRAGGPAPEDEMASRLLLGAIQLGAITESERWVEMLPVDWAARVIIHLARIAKPKHVRYHIAQPQPLTQADFRRMLADSGYPLEPLSFAAWRDRLARDHQNVLAPLLPLFTDAVTEEGKSQAELAQEMPRFDASHVIEDLSEAGRIEQAWAPTLDGRLLRRYLRRLVAEAPPSWKAKVSP